MPMPMPRPMPTWRAVPSRPLTLPAPTRLPARPPTPPSQAGAMVRHFTSLRSMRRDNGWIHTLLEEAENERMHLLTFLHLKKPGPLMRAAVLVTQGVFFNSYLVLYMLSPRLCHRAVGYLEEEAVATCEWGGQWGGQ